MKLINYDDISFYCNACGEIFDPHVSANVNGVAMPKDLTPDELPLPLRELYEKRWSDGSGSLCYLVMLNKRPGLLLDNEYDDCYAADMGVGMEELYEIMQQRGQHMERLLHAINPAIEVYIGKNSGCSECHELLAFLPADLTDEESIKAFYICYRAAYDAEFIPSYKSRDFLTFAQSLYGFVNAAYPSISISVRIPDVGTLVIQDICNKQYPGVSIDLKRQDRTTIALAKIQKGYSGHLQATLFSELSADDYTHRIDFVSPGRRQKKMLTVDG
jgi:hypothetical protein